MALGIVLHVAHRLNLVGRNGDRVSLELLRVVPVPMVRSWNSVDVMVGISVVGFPVSLISEGLNPLVLFEFCLFLSIS